MVKKSLIQSTEKKKSASKKSDVEKKATDGKKTKKSTRKPPAPKKAAPSKKKSTQAASVKKGGKVSETKKSKAPAKPRATAKDTAAKTKKAPAKKTKKWTVKELIFKRFDPYVPERPYAPAPDAAAEADYTAPPFVSAADENEVRRIRALLLKKFDMAEIVAASEKAAAEKEAAEKAAAEKEASEKAAAQKAAAEKAAAEKEASEKAAAEKAAAEKVTVTYEQPSAPHEEPPPEDKIEKYAMVGLAAGVALIFLMVTLASWANTGNFHLKPSENGLEIWRGKFAPMGKRLYVSLPGVEAPLTIRESYTRAEVMPLAFQHYLDKADQLLETTGTPDFDRIKAHLNTALTYAVTNEMRDTALARLNSIDFMLLLYKATVSASRGTSEDLDSALGFLDQAAVLAVDDAQERLVEERIAALERRKETLETAEPAPE